MQYKIVHVKVGVTLRVPFANVLKSHADGTYKVPATLSFTAPREGNSADWSDYSD